MSEPDSPIRATLADTLPYLEREAGKSCGAEDLATRGDEYAERHLRFCWSCRARMLLGYAPIVSGRQEGSE